MSLLTEIQSGSRSTEIAPHIISGNDGLIAEIFNRKDIETFGKVSWSDFVDWSIYYNLMGVIQDTSTDITSPLRSSALALIKMLESTFDGPDFSKQSNISMLDAWVSAGKISLEAKTSLLSLSKTFISYAESLHKSDPTFPNVVTSSLVAQTLRP